MKRRSKLINAGHSPSKVEVNGALTSVRKRVNVKEGVSVKRCAGVRCAEGEWFGWDLRNSKCLNVLRSLILIDPTVNRRIMLHAALIPWTRWTSKTISLENVDAEVAPLCTCRKFQPGSLTLNYEDFSSRFKSIFTSARRGILTWQSSLNTVQMHIYAGARFTSPFLSSCKIVTTAQRVYCVEGMLRLLPAGRLTLRWDCLN